jgi:predicted nucleic acid binding AN1-type Zn finger protein
MSSNLLLVAHIYKTYDEYEFIRFELEKIETVTIPSEEQENNSKIAAATFKTNSKKVGLISSSKKNYESHTAGKTSEGVEKVKPSEKGQMKIHGLFGLIQRLQDDDCATENCSNTTTASCSNTDVNAIQQIEKISIRFEIIELVRMRLREIRELKKNLFENINWFTFFWYAEAFFGTIFRLTAILERKTKTFQFLVQVSGFYFYGMFFILFITYVADKTAKKQKHRYHKMVDEIHEIKPVNVKEEQMKKSIMNELKQLSSAKPMIGSLFQLNWKTVFHFYGHVIPFTVYCRDLFLQT